MSCGVALGPARLRLNRPPQICLLARLLPGMSLLLVLGATGCKTAAQYQADADAEVYALIDARRAKLFSEEGGFSIETQADNLRERMLAGETLPEPLSLIDCLQIAAENNRDYQAAREDLYRAALDLTLEQWQFESQGFGSASAVIDGTGNDANSSTNSGSVGFSRALGNGAQFVASLGSSLFRIVSGSDGWDVVSDLSLTFTQPLLRGAGKRIARENLTQAERSLVYEVRDFERFRRTFAVDVATQVYDLLQAIDQLANEEQNLESLRLLRERNAALAEAGRLSDIEADQARQQALNSENRALTLGTSLEGRWDSFKLFLGVPIEAEITLDPAEFANLTEKDELLSLLTEGVGIEIALSQRLDYQTTLDQLDDQIRAVEIAEDGLGADLGLTVQGDTASVEGRPASLAGNSSTWSAALAVDLPFDRMSERNTYKRALITLEATERGVTLQTDLVRIEVRESLRQVANSRESYDIQVGALAVAEHLLEGAQLSLEAGRLETRAVLDAQSDLTQARNDKTSALVDLTLARLQLYLDMEMLRVDEDGIGTALELSEWLAEDTQQ